MFSIKYLLNLGVGAMAIPMIAYLHNWGGGFTTIFQVLGIAALITFVFVITLPKPTKIILT